MPRSLKRKTLREQAEHALREMIGSYRFAPGKWINVERLAKDLGVSRTPVWQALKTLETEGLVVHVPNRGIRMAEMTPQMATDLYTVRGPLEGLAARLAAERINQRTLKKMDSLLRSQREVVNRADVVAYSKLDFEFHAYIYEASGNWLIKELLENIKARSRPIICDITPILPELYDDHEKVVEALTDGRPAQAEQVMLRHNRRMRRLVDVTE